VAVKGALFLGQGSFPFKPFGRLLAPRRGLYGEMRGRVTLRPRFFCFFPWILNPDFEVS
jgi:hypothetical protein